MFYQGILYGPQDFSKIKIDRRDWKNTENYKANFLNIIFEISSIIKLRQKPQIKSAGLRIPAGPRLRAWV
jgi:hypothetical protein